MASNATRAFLTTMAEAQSVATDAGLMGGGCDNATDGDACGDLEVTSGDLNAMGDAASEAVANADAMMSKLIPDDMEAVREAEASNARTLRLGHTHTPSRQPSARPLVLKASLAHTHTQSHPHAIPPHGLC